MTDLRSCKFEADFGRFGFGAGLLCGLGFAVALFLQLAQRGGVFLALAAEVSREGFIPSGT